MGKFARIYIRVFYVIASTWDNKSYFAMHIFLRILRNANYAKICTVRKFLFSQYYKCINYLHLRVLSALKDNWQIIQFLLISPTD